MSLQDISNTISVIPQENGVFYRDISTLLTNPELYDLAITMLADMVKDIKIDMIGCLESHGYLLGASLATKLEKGIVMFRKPTKISDEILVQYGLKGNNVLTIQKNIVSRGSSILLIDDILSSGGTLVGACELVESIGCHVAGCMCLIELLGVHQRKELTDYKLFTLIKLPSNSADKFISKQDELLHRKPIEYIFTNNILPTDDRIIVFSHPSTKSIANSITSCSKYFRTGVVSWQHYGDGYPNITYENLQHLTNKRIVFFASLYDRSSFSEQLAMLSVLPEHSIKSLDIFVLHFAPGQLKTQSVDKDHTLATAEAYATIMSNCMFITQNGPPRIHIFDAHSVDTRSWFSNSIVNLDTAIPLLKEKINKETITIVFPDASAFDRFGLQFSDYRTMCLSKYNSQIIHKTNWPSLGYDTNCFDDVIIIDDSIQTGDSFEKCREVLVQMGAKKVSAYATHGVFLNGAHKKFLFNENYHKFYVTNSVPEISHKLEGLKPFEIIKLDNMILNNLLNLFQIKDVDLTPPTEFNVYVASENEVKLSATYEAINQTLKTFGNENFKINVFGINVQSEVSEQPVNEETYSGCFNRFNNLCKYVEYHNLDCDIFVSIESGMYYEGDLTENTITRDHSQVIVMTRSDVSTVKSEKLSKKFTEFPAKFLLESVLANKEITVGKIIEKAYGYKAGSWQKHYGDKISRHQIISETIVEAFVETCGDIIE